MLETRLTARDKQLDYDRDLPRRRRPAELAAFKAKLADPGPQDDGRRPGGLARRRAKASVKAGRAWQVLGNEVVMGRLMAPSLRKEMGEAKLAEALAGAAGARRRLARLERLAALGLPYGLDMWDGYPADRERLYGLIRQGGQGPRSSCVSGDSHAFWANELHDAPGERVAVEFGATGITSPGGGDAIRAFRSARCSPRPIARWCSPTRRPRASSC